jgi:hypothetical protein
MALAAADDETASLVPVGLEEPVGEVAAEVVGVELVVLVAVLDRVAVGEPALSPPPSRPEVVAGFGALVARGALVVRGAELVVFGGAVVFGAVAVGAGGAIPGVWPEPKRKPMTLPAGGLYDAVPMLL